MEAVIHSTLIKEFINKGFVKTNSLDDKITEKDLLNIYQVWSKTMINPTTFHKLMQENNQISFTKKRYYVCLKLECDNLNTLDTEKEQHRILTNKKQTFNLIDELQQFIKQMAQESNEDYIKIFSPQLYQEFVKQTGNKHLSQTKFGLNVVKIEGVTRRIVAKGNLYLINTAKFKDLD